MERTSGLVTALAEPDTAKGKQGTTVSPARRVAFEILQRVDKGAYASVLLASREEELRTADRALCHELVMGVLRWQLWLDKLIEHYSNLTIAKADPAVRITLRLGLYQLRFLSRIPASAAVNESVNLMRLARLSSAKSFVNAVLRRATREPRFNPAANISDPVARIAIETSHPSWLIERWTQAFGLAETEALAAANNQPAPIAFRIVPARATEAEVIDQLRATGASLYASEIAQGAWRVGEGGGLLRELSGAGKVYLQDEASQLVAQVLEAQPGDRVLDVCAAPGSKATQIASSLGSVRVFAGDLHENRLRAVAQAARLQNARGLQCVVLNGLEPLPFPDGSFDRVLIDAPCSGTGTLRRNPEIRWRISAEDIRDLSSRQERLLNNASLVLKPGGRLVYSTCSFEPEENEAVISAFLQDHDQFQQVKLPLNPSLVTQSGGLRTWPSRDGADGFFIALLESKS